MSPLRQDCRDPEAGRRPALRSDAIWKESVSACSTTPARGGPGAMRKTVAGPCSNECGQHTIDPTFQGQPKRWGYPGRRPPVVSDNRMPISAAR